MKDFITYELAVKLKEKGYPQHICDYAYIIEDDYEENKCVVRDREYIPFIPEYLPTIAAPIISQVLKWLREEKKIYVGITYMPKVPNETGVLNDFYYPTFQKIGLFEPMFFIGNGKNYDTYEQAAIAGIEYVLDDLI